jgi:phosphoribosylformimino-5-aminoimidazole carboxamide ribotide isomerase
VLRAAAAAHGAHLIYSGGIGSLEDLRVLASLEAPSLVGVVVGKALYEGRFTVAQAQAALA